MRGYSPCHQFAGSIPDNRAVYPSDKALKPASQP